MRLTSTTRFSGLDSRRSFTSDLSAASGMRNIRVTDSGALEKRPGRRLLHEFDGDVEGIWSGSLAGEETLLVSCRGDLLKYDPAEDETTVIGAIGAGHCEFFCFNGALYILNGDDYYKYDGSALTAVEGYVPLVAVSCEPNGSGTVFEQINLLTPLRRQLFSATGTDGVYMLAEKAVDGVEAVLLDGAELPSTAYSCNGTTGAVTFTSPPSAGTNNLEITYSKTGDGRKRITDCRCAMIFGGNTEGRVFLWDNPDLPDLRFHSGLADGIPSAEYFPVNNFTRIGGSKITCIVQQYDRQLVFTPERAFYSYCELREDSLGNLTASFPVYSLNGEKGSLLTAPGCIIDNSPATVCDDGINIWESTAVENEKNAVCISGAISDRVRDAVKQYLPLGKLKLFDLQMRRELYFVCLDYAYVYNYCSKSWYYYDGFGCDEYCVCGDRLLTSKGKKLFSRYDGEASDETGLTCVWQSNYCDTGIKSGDPDVLLVEADADIVGPGALTLKVDGRNGDASVSRTYTYTAADSGPRRLSIRPHFRRRSPMRLTLSFEGAGGFAIHGVTVKSKTRERKNRNG